MGPTLVFDAKTNTSNFQGLTREDIDLVQYLQSPPPGYFRIYQMPDGTLAALMPLMFTVAIVAGLTRTGYEDRWCYHSMEAAECALQAWDGEGEPAGWHRHPATGRRIDKSGVMHVAY